MPVPDLVMPSPEPVNAFAKEVQLLLTVKVLTAPSVTLVELPKVKFPVTAEPNVVFQLLPANEVSTLEIVRSVASVLVNVIDAVVPETPNFSDPLPSALLSPIWIVPVEMVVPPE